jgi:hypothetical protein
MTLGKKGINLKHFIAFCFLLPCYTKIAIRVCFILLRYKILSNNAVIFLPYYVDFLFFLTVYKLYKFPISTPN